ncbi:hypothetical protein J6590_059231 [Homalodisca vitripennis]|nr:hypothetical protein J6590_059231 [Homalodisca vitripennis]
MSSTSKYDCPVGNNYSFELRAFVQMWLAKPQPKPKILTADSQGVEGSQLSACGSRMVAADYVTSPMWAVVRGVSTRRRGAANLKPEQTKRGTER